MTYLKQRHNCDTPGGRIGDIWQCDECGKVWRFSRIWQAWTSGPLLRRRYRNHSPEGQP